MRPALHCRLLHRVVFCATALSVLGLLTGVTRGEEWRTNALEPDYFRNAANSGALTTGHSSPFAEAVQKGEECQEDFCWNCNLCPCHYAVVEALILERNLQGSTVPLVVDAETGDPLLTTDDLDFPFSGGLRAYIGHRFCDGWAWELGYFGLFGANASTTAEGNLALADDLGAGTNVFFGADRIALDYTSDVHSGELNFVCCCCCCEPCGCQEQCQSIEWIYGLRYFRVNESLDIAAEREETFGSETGSYNVNASNDLYGGQFGARLRRCRGPWSLEGTGKLGLYYNDAHQTQTVTDFPDFVLRQSGASSDWVSTVVDLNASLIRQISAHWYLRGGYNLMWIDGVALAPSQLDFSQTATSGTDIDSGDTLFLHGFNVGFEGRW